MLIYECEFLMFKNEECDKKSILLDHYLLNYKTSTKIRFTTETMHWFSTTLKLNLTKNYLGYNFTD